MMALAIDPGLTGGVALVCSERGLLEIADIPTQQAAVGKAAIVQRWADAVALDALLERWERRHLAASIGVLERLQPFMGKGERKGASPVALVSMGQTWGVCHSALTRHCAKVVYPTPQQWKRGYALASDKSKSVDEVIRRFQVRLRHDQAEAVLLALWGTGMVAIGAPAEQTDDIFG